MTELIRLAVGIQRKGKSTKGWNSQTWLSGGDELQAGGILLREGGNARPFQAGRKQEKLEIDPQSYPKD